MVRSTLCAAALLASSVAAATPLTMTHQGRVLGTTGIALEGLTDLTFRLYADPSTGTALFTETHSVDLAGGYYAVTLGTIDDLDSTVFDGSVRYLGVPPSGLTELTPRTAVHSVPYAMQAGRVAVASTDPGACSASTAGSVYFHTGVGALRVCDGSAWVSTSTTPTGKTCREILAANGSAADGLYTLDPDGVGPASSFETFCDMTGGGWTLLARSEREGLTTAEYAAIREGTFADYGVTGIGDPSPASRMFWLPLDDWHELTSAFPNNVWKIEDTLYDMRLRDFSVGDAASEYVLDYGTTVPTFTSPFSASPTLFQGMRFTTIDNDNDLWSSNCSSENPSPSGGFWYESCHQHSMAHNTGNLYSWQTNASQQVGWIKLWFRQN